MHTQRVGGLDQARLQRLVERDRGDLPYRVVGPDRLCHAGAQQFFLVGERTEDRGLADTRGTGDLVGGHGGAVLGDQRQRRSHDHGSPLFGRHPRRSPPGGGFCHAAESTE
jgi:hypothetical protein